MCVVAVKVLGSEGCVCVYDECFKTRDVCVPIHRGLGTGGL